LLAPPAFRGLQRFSACAAGIESIERVQLRLPFGDAGKDRLKDARRREGAAPVTPEKLGGAHLMERLFYGHGIRLSILCALMFRFVPERVIFLRVAGPRNRINGAVPAGL